MLIITWIIVTLAALWVWSGFQKIPIGSRGLLTFLGKRQEKDFGEGWQWAPLPWDIVEVDCREIIMKLGTLKAITEDNIEVTVGSTIVYQVKNISLYLGVKKEEIRTGLDEKRTEVLRSQIRKYNLKKVLDIHEELGALVKNSIEHKEWGIDIKQVIVPEIEPDPKIKADLALKEQELLQKAGQEVELDHFISKVNKLMSPPPTGAGLSREQAIEQVQLAIGKAAKNIDAKTITLDPVTAALVAEVLRRK